jgi:hypothetical protein
MAAVTAAGSRATDQGLRGPVPGGPAAGRLGPVSDRGRISGEIMSQYEAAR